MTSSPTPWPLAVIFDLDGTLIDSAGDIASALNNVMETRGFAPFEMVKVREMIGGGIPKLVEKAFLSHGVQPDDLEPVIMDFLKVYAANCVVDTKLYDGALPLLERLHADGVKIGLCTNKQQAISEEILERLGIAHFFGAVVGERKGQPRKPDAEPLRLAMQQLGVTAAETLMVGDSAADSGCAQAAGVPVALVTFGYTHTLVSQLGAQALIDQLSELPSTFTAIHRTYESDPKR
ncbi:MAG: HAD-IIIA family hydrolase [Hyphomicrobiales bacterium]|nr:HAD-IIIA family hydrolase [Hyphomicrobiales bacterium]